MILSTSAADEVALTSLLLEKRCCVLFVGAGVSIPPAKSWDSLVQTLARKCEVKPRKSEPLPVTIDRCMRGKRRLSLCNAAFRKEFPLYTATTRTALLNLLRLPFKAILTTNFDPWLQQQSRTENYKNGVFVYPNLPLSGNGVSNAIYYLHGNFSGDDPDFSIENLVFGKKSFDDAYRHSLLPGFLLNVLTYENMLFVGFDPIQGNIARILTASLKLRRGIAKVGGSSDTPRRFILSAVAERMTGEERAADAGRDDDLRGLDVTPIRYQQGGRDFKGLEEVLMDWINRGDLENRPAPFARGFDAVPTVAP